MSKSEPGCRCVLCAPPLRQFGKPWVRQLLAEVRTQGWTVVGVAEDGEYPGWAYTVGLTHSYGVTELAMFGLDVDDLQHWVSTLGTAIATGRTHATDGPIDRAILGLPAELRLIDPSWNEALFGVANNFYQGSQFQVRQVVWGDRGGRFPWDDGVVEQSRQDQPTGWLPANQASPRWAGLLAE
jgi:hypothetical protein